LMRPPSYQPRRSRTRKVQQRWQDASQVHQT